MSEDGKLRTMALEVLVNGRGEICFIHYFSRNYRILHGYKALQTA